MGYTHYWTAPSQRDDQWKKLTILARMICRIAQDDMGIALSEDYDVNRIPVINDEEIRFNGYGDEGHETFMFEPNGEWTFCKTAMKPYDTVVVAILYGAQQLIPGFEWSSDGDPEDHQAGIKLAVRAADGALQVAAGQAVSRTLMQLMDNVELSNG